MISETLVLALCFAAVNLQQVPGTSCNFNNGRCVYYVTLGHAGTCGSTDGGSSCPAKCLQVESELQTTKIELLSSLVKMKDQVIASGKKVNETRSRVDGHDTAIADTMLFVQRQARDTQMLGLKVTGLENEIRKMADDNDKLEKKFEYFMTVVNGTRNELNRKTAELLKEKQEREKLLKQLGINEKLHNQTMEQLKQTINSLTSTLEKKSDELANVAAKLQRCHTASKNASSSCGTPPIVPQNDYQAFFCDFESNDNCQFSQSGGDISWSRQKGNYGYGGPQWDDTYGTPKGAYMLVNPMEKITYSSRERVARMTSPSMPADGHGYCVSFYYYMSGSDQRLFNVYAQVTGGLGYPIWTKEKDQGAIWNVAQIDISPEYTRNNFSVVFEGRLRSYYTTHNTLRRYNYMSFPSLDDVQITNRPCAVFKTCPAGSIQMKNNPKSCYTFVSTPLAWYDAVNYCRKIRPSGHLIAVKSKEVQDFVLETVAKSSVLASVNHLGWYTSGNDEKRENEFVWANYNYQTISSTYRKWTPGQPNNVASNQHCILMEKEPEMTWGDVDCKEKHPFICEFKV